MKKKICKIIGFSMFSLCVMTAAVFAAVRTEASGSNQIQYLERTYTADNTAPTDIPDGYLFAGWYTDADATTVDPVVNPVLQQTYYAKFVPKEVLGIVAQVSKNVLEEETSDKTGNSIRIVTSLDSEQYQHIGFRIQKGNGTPYDANTTKKVYEALYAIGATEATEENLLTYTPQNSFHAVSTYFKTWTINKIPETAFNTDITITPYWITLDGTRVNGATGIKTVNLGRSWIYVDAEATDSTQLGTYNEPYTTISGAVAYETELNPTVILKDNTSDTMTVSETVDITRNVTLTNENNFTLIRDSVDSVFKGEFFYVSEDSALSLENASDNSKLILDGSKSAVVAEKALIFVDGTLNINEGVTLQNNAHGDGDVTTPDTNNNGGAIYLDDTAALNMTGGTITGNETIGNGGAIHAAAKSQMDLKNVELSYNTAAGQAGAINFPAASAKDNLVTLENVKIIHNKATNWASGAIYVGTYRQLKIDGASTEISNNTSTGYGGAIGVGGANAEVTIGNGMFYNNTSSTANGGAICINKSAVLTINGGTFENNTAQNGGAIALNATSTTLTISEGTFTSNTATNTSGNNGGGAIYALYDTTITIDDVEMGSNTSKRRGGAIYLAPNSSSGNHSGKLTLTDVTIKGNTTSNAAGAIFAAHGWDVEINGATTEISGNTAGANGGAIVTGQYVNITMKAGTISGNKANGGDGAGAIYFWGTTSALTTFTMTGGTIKDNVDNTTYKAHNIRANNPVLIQLSDAANLTSVCWQSGAGKIQVTAPLTTENVNTVVSFPSYTADTIAVSYTGETETDMTALCSKFSLANTQYTLSVSENNLVVSEVTE